MIYVLNVNPHTKPRMTRSDKWKHRPCVDAYFAFKDELILEAKRIKLPILPEKFSIEFHIEMPDTWSVKKKNENYRKPHQQTPDIDNLTKSFFDCLLKQDNYIWSIKVEKVWDIEGYIQIEF
jgi:Holliday junction resolvase RusA-like endonuclease